MAHLGSILMGNEARVLSFLPPAAPPPGPPRQPKGGYTSSPIYRKISIADVSKKYRYISATPIYDIQLAEMSFDEIFDLTADVYIYLMNIFDSIVICYDTDTQPYNSWLFLFCSCPALKARIP